MKSTVIKQANENAEFHSWPWLAALLAATMSLVAQGVYAQTLQGQSKGNPAWLVGNLDGWAELEYIPLRLSFPAGSAGSHTVTLNFPHFNNKTFGIEDLYGFSSVANAQLAGKPVLATSLNGSWAYTLNIQITDNNPAAIPFTARLASGAHLFGGSSLQIKSSAGNLQIHSALAVAGAPDLALSLSGPSTAVEGGTVSYSLTYTNKASTYGASGVQVNQTLPVEIRINPVTLPANARLVGNTLFWDLGNLSPKASGKLTFNATVAVGAAIGADLVIASQIVSAENDQNMLDNEATITTTVVCGGVTTSIVSEPASASGCPGDPIELSVSTVGPSGLTYQWYKDGVVLAGATNGTYTIAGLRSLDLGTYTVTVMSPCGDVASQPAVVSVNPEPPVTIQGQAFQADGSFALEFGTGCGGSYIVEYTSDFVVWKQSPVTVPGQQATARWVDAGPPATESKPDAQSHRCYRVLRSF